MRAKGTIPGAGQARWGGSRRNPLPPSHGPFFYNPLMFPLFLSYTGSLMLTSKWARIAVGWSAVIVIGVGGFVFTKQTIEQQRRESMKVRERMRNANTGDYESKRNFTG
ncbi:hypothetical protein O3P69_018747 [Scylla paramamosain]|uniref:Uncharacterized protein n=1 Tax=Scylla paramamosain TaxID=85552 RepID=A0AAW0SSG4_SCYPA